jgi:hypothetical protein
LKKEIQFATGKVFLRRILKKIGFKFKKCKNKRSFLMERNDTESQRATYLRRMKKNDELGSNKNSMCIRMKHGFT